MSTLYVTIIASTTLDALSRLVRTVVNQKNTLSYETITFYLLQENEYISLVILPEIVKYLSEDVQV